MPESYAEKPDAPEAIVIASALLSLGGLRARH